MTGFAKDTESRLNAPNLLAFKPIDYEALLPVVLAIQKDSDDGVVRLMLDVERAAARSPLLEQFDRITHGRLLPPQPFKSDGCTYSPDSFGKQCCILHDLAYWLGGSREDRRHADALLKGCTCKHGEPAEGRVCRTFREALRLTAHRLYAPVQWAGVRVLGHPLTGDPIFCGFFDRSRWGYGWPYPAVGEQGIVY